MLLPRFSLLLENSTVLQKIESSFTAGEKLMLRLNKHIKEIKGNIQRLFEKLKILLNEIYPRIARSYPINYRRYYIRYSRNARSRSREDKIIIIVSTRRKDYQVNYKYE